MSKTKSRTGLSNLSEEGGVPHQRLTAFNRAAPTETRQWYKIENKSSKDETEVYILDEIGGWWGVSASDFISALKKITTPKIKLHLNSPGGEVFDGVAIFNALRDHDAEVTVIVDALAASAASFIAQAGDKIIMNRGSTMMIHDGLAFCVGNEKDMLDTATVLDKISNNIADIYAERAGGTLEDWRALMREEVWYTAQEAVDAGLADEVASSIPPAEAVEASNRWDLSIFNHAGRSDAPSPDEVRQRITNRAKEAPVPTKATAPRAETTDTTPPETAPTTPPEVTAPEAPEEEPTVEPTAPAAPEAPAVEPPATPTNKAGAVMFTVNGVQTSDPKAIQAHISSLEGFRDDTLTATRKAFCESLVNGNKITAPQLSGIEAFALGLSSDQFDTWKATWDVAPKASVLVPQAEGVTNPAGDLSQKEAAVKDRIETLKGIVKLHKQGGMSNEKIEATASYKELTELVPDYKL